MKISTPCSYAQNTFVPVAATVVERLSAAIVFFGGRRNERREPAGPVFFETFFDMEQLGFDPISKDIALLIDPRMWDARNMAPELAERTFRVVTAFVFLHAGKAAIRSMKSENAKQFSDALAQSLAEHSAGRFGFEKDAQAAARAVSDLLLSLNCDTLFNARSFGTDDGFGALLRQLTSWSDSSAQYAFVLGSKGNSMGLWARYLTAIKIFDFIPSRAKELAW